MTQLSESESIIVSSVNASKKLCLRKFNSVTTILSNSLVMFNYPLSQLNKKQSVTLQVPYYTEITPFQMLISPLFPTTISPNYGINLPPISYYKRTQWYQYCSTDTQLKNEFSKIQISWKIVWDITYNKQNINLVLQYKLPIVMIFVCIWHTGILPLWNLIMPYNLQKLASDPFLFFG